MTSTTYRDDSSSGAELYERFFVPGIATPVSGELIATGDLRGGERVIDIACGTGVIARAAADQVGAAGTVTGVDAAPDMLEVARATAARGAPIQWHEADAASLPLSDESYDVAFCQMGLMFMRDKPGAVAEMHRVLAPGGRVVLNTPGRVQPPFEVMERAIREHINPDLGAFVSAVFSMPDPAVLAAMLRDAGFRDVSSKEYVVRLNLPDPAVFLWNYINLTPMGPLVAEAPEDARDAMEAQVVEALDPHVVDGRVPIDQPMALAWGTRS
ncbi:MAG: methyltransferase domain-containing protein [Thermoleophilia bacterium]|nr:methyltransferase domain-containing protein [Thermoleophilia bacterium]